MSRNILHGPCIEFRIARVLRCSRSGYHLDFLKSTELKRIHSPSSATPAVQAMSPCFLLCPGWALMVSRSRFLSFTRPRPPRDPSHGASPTPPPWPPCPPRCTSRGSGCRPCRWALSSGPLSPLARGVECWDGLIRFLGLTGPYPRSPNLVWRVLGSGGG